jgi:hypothetical protein
VTEVAHIYNPSTQEVESQNKQIKKRQGTVAQPVIPDIPEAEIKSLKSAWAKKLVSCISTNKLCMVAQAYHPCTWEVLSRKLIKPHAAKKKKRM